MTGYRIKVETVLDTAKIRAELAGMKNLKTSVTIDDKFATSVTKGTNALGNQVTVTDKLNKTTGVTATKFKEATDKSESFGATLLHNAKAAATWAIAMGVLYGSLRKVQEGVQFVYYLDNQMNNIQMITQGTNEQTKELAQTYNALAGQLSSNTLDVAKNAEEWLRQGRTVGDTNTLIKASMVLSKVGMIESAEAASLLTSAINGYGLSASEAMSVVDKMSAIDVVAATSTKDLALAMQQTAASGKLAGVSMDELYSYIAVVSDVTQQSAETIGNSFKTIFARMNQVKIGSLVDSEDGSDLSNVDKVLKEYSIDLRNAQGTFRDTGDVLDEIAAKWNTLNTMQQSEIATTISGVRQRDRFLVLMSNYDKALKYQKVSLESAGSAEQKMTIYKESAAAATERLTNAFQKLFMGMDSGIIKGFINAGTGILTLINNIGGLRTILLVLIGTILTLKGAAIATALTGMLAPIKAMIMFIPNLVSAFNMARGAGLSFAGSLKVVGAVATTTQMAMSGLFLALTVASVVWGAVSAARDKDNQVAQEGLETYQSQITALGDLKTKLDETISGTGTESEKRATLIEMIKGMNTEYEKEAINLKTTTELRNLAVAKMKEEGLEAAKAFFAKSDAKYQEAKKFIEEPGFASGESPTFASGVDTSSFTSAPTSYTSVKEKIQELSDVISELVLKREKGIKLSRAENELLFSSQKQYGELSTKYEELLPYYDQGNAALKIQNEGMEISSGAVPKVVSAFDAFADVLSRTSSDLSGFSGELDLLDSALTKLAGSQSLTAKEIFALINQYPELIDSLKESAGVYYLEAGAIESVKNGLIAKNEVELKVAFSSADAVAKSVGINIDSYSQELDAIKTLINAQIVLKQARMESMQNLSYAAQMGYLKEAQNLKSLLDSIGSLKKQKTMLGLISSGQDIKAVSSKTGEDAAEKAQKEAEDAAKKAQEEAEYRLKTTIELKLSLLDAEKQATEDSFDAQIKALEEINKTRQDEIDLIKAKEALLNAQTNKKMVYREGMGFIAEVDATAIADAEQTIAEIAIQKQIENLESQKESAGAGADLKKTEYENSLLQLMKSETNSGLRSVYGSILGLTELDGAWYDTSGKRAFRGGGLADFTGTAHMDGTKQKPELVLNNPQASALFNFIQGLANPSITRTPAMAGGSNSTMNIGTINLPSVKNGSDFIQELQLISKNR